MTNPIDPQILSLAAHEFRTPASVVGGYLRMLQRDQDPPLSERQRHMVDEAARSCGRLVELVAELSELGKLDSTTATGASLPFDFFETIGDVANGVHEASDRGVQLELIGLASGAPIQGDRTRLGAAIRAILRAVLRERPGPETVIADRRLVRDGVSTSAVVVVGERELVQRGVNAKTRFDELRGGLGLSLPIARRVIEKHGGRLESPAGPDGRGVAIVTLPLSEHSR